MAGVGSVLIEVAALLGFTVLACRWVFGSGGIRRTRPRPDYGLLSVVRRTDTEAQALVAAELVMRTGLRATVAPAGAGFTASGRPWPADAHVVLVFPHDADTARAVLDAAERQDRSAR